mmetsp:Transcript_6677/g.11831  ORF Transcript_6677/g.11831 Transcript_6677/m.11831 type:complete len:471 (-) Transcript_6677:221-1633(-)
MDCAGNIYERCAVLMGLTAIGLAGGILGSGLNGKFGIQPSDAMFGNIVTSSVQAPAATSGSCQMVASRQPPAVSSWTAENNLEWCNAINHEGPVWTDPRHPACYPIGVPKWHPEDNIIVTLPNPADCAVSVSDTWTIAGWHVTYVQLAPNAVFTPPQLSWAVQSMLKVYRGSVIDVGENGVMNEDLQWETFTTTPPLASRSLKVPHFVREVRAGTSGAVFAWFTVPSVMLEQAVTNMGAAPATTIGGPFSNLLNWRTFADRSNDTQFSPNFWNMPGIKLNENDGTHLTYNQWWTNSESDPVDGGYHNHGDTFANNTFAELHMTMYAATASAGMQTQMPNTQNQQVQENPSQIPDLPGAGTWYGQNDMSEVQLVLPMPPGYAHGPLWAVNADGTPRTCAGSGRVVYPFHRLVLGTNPADLNGGTAIGPFSDPPRYQLWMAFEHLPGDVNIPPQMLAAWHNAYLQNEDGTNC